MGALGAGTVVQKEKENETHDRGGPLFKPARRGRCAAGWAGRDSHLHNEV
jgi:hypothetical protein